MRFAYTTVLVGMVVSLAASAQAGLYQDIYRGLDTLATPLGSVLGTTADGTRVDGARSGRLRIVPSGVGGGYELQFDRTFGNDSTGRPETLRIGGLVNMTLSGSTSATVGYTGLRDSFYKSGHASFSANNLGYNIRTTNGAQDLQLAGTLSVSNAFEVNTLGFYTATININNTNSTLTQDGLATRGTVPENFTVGPIVVKGNIFADGAAALVTSIGGNATPIEQLFPSSPVDLIDAAIRDRLQAASATGTALTSANAYDPNQLLDNLVNSVLNQDSDAAQKLLTDLASGANLQSLGTGDQSLQDAATLAVPEPAAIALMVSGFALLRRRP